MPSGATSRANDVVDATAADRMVVGILERIEDPDPLLRFLGEQVADFEAEVFATRGFGTWAPLDPATVQIKGSTRVLVDNGDLLDDLTRPSGGSIRHEEDSVAVITDEQAAAYLKRGARGMSVRDPAPEPPASRVERWAEDALGFIIDGGYT